MTLDCGFDSPEFSECCKAMMDYLQTQFLVPNVNEWIKIEINVLNNGDNTFMFTMPVVTAHEKIQ